MSANLPSDFNLSSNKPMSAAGVAMINRYRSDNSTYASNGSSQDTVRIEISCGRNGQYLFPRDSFLEGKLSVSATDTTASQQYVIDQSVYSLFNRIKVMHGSNVLEDYLYANRVWTSIFDLQVTESARRGDCITKLVNDNTTNTDNSIFNDGCSGARLLTTSATASALTFGAANDFCFVLPSGLLGSLAQKALPIGLMGASSLYLELELSPANVALVTASVTNSTISYEMSEIYYNAKICQLPADVNELVVESTGGYVNLPACSYKSEMKSIGTGATAFNDKFSFQFSSMKNFNFFFQNTASATGSIIRRSVSSRPKCNLKDYFLLLNGAAYPSQSITNQARMYAETLRAWGTLSSTQGSGIISYQNYNYSDHTVGTDVYTSITATDQKRFIAGIDLDRFGGMTTDTLMAGTSSIGQMINLNLNFSAATTDPLNLYAFCTYDCLYHLENGLLSVKF